VPPQEGPLGLWEPQKCYQTRPSCHLPCQYHSRNHVLCLEELRHSLSPRLLNISCPNQVCTPSSIMDQAGTGPALCPPSISTLAPDRRLAVAPGQKLPHLPDSNTSQSSQSDLAGSPAIVNPTEQVLALATTKRAQPWGPRRWAHESVGSNTNPPDSATAADSVLASVAYRSPHVSSPSLDLAESAPVVNPTEHSLCLSPGHLRPLNGPSPEASAGGPPEADEAPTFPPDSAPSRLGTKLLQPCQPFHHRIHPNMP